MYISTVLLHNGGFCNNYTPKRCLHMSVHFQTNALKTLFLHKGYMKSMEFYKNYITLFCLDKNKLVDNIILTQNHARHVTQSV